MNQLKLYHLIAFLAISIIILISCGNSADKTSSSDQGKTVNETDTLLDFIGNTGDIINSEQAPFLVQADEVFENLANYLILDIRDTSDYYAGHIDGAIWVDARALVDYLDISVNPNRYEKIIIACYSGQTASFYTTLLRLIGHANVYALKFGMSGWSKKISPNRILSNISDKYTANLENKNNIAEKTYDFPNLKTGKTGGYQIMLARVKTLAEEGFGPAAIKVDTLMKNPSDYFIVNYWPAEHYNKGHLPGSVCFEPRKSFVKDKMLSYLPTDKTVVVYCLSGQTSASMVAYLRVLGYNARSLSFGANGFMHNCTQAFNDKVFMPARDIADYPLVEGKNPSLQTTLVLNAGQSVKEEKTPATAPIKKKQKNTGGGC